MNRHPNDRFISDERKQKKLDKLDKQFRSILNKQLKKAQLQSHDELSSYTSDNLLRLAEETIKLQSELTRELEQRAKLARGMVASHGCVTPKYELRDEFWTAYHDTLHFMTHQTKEEKQKANRDTTYEQMKLRLERMNKNK